MFQSGEIKRFDNFGVADVLLYTFFIGGAGVLVYSIVQALRRVF